MSSTPPSDSNGPQPRPSIGNESSIGNDKTGDAEEGQAGRCPSQSDLLHGEFAAQLVRIAWAYLGDRELAKDAVQETYLLFSQKQPDILAGSEKGWLVKTVQFQARNMRRKHQRSERLVKDLKLQWPHTEADENDSLMKQERIQRVQDAIRQLPIKQQEVVLRRLRDDTTFADIALELKIPLGTVLSRMRLALDKLKASLVDER